MLKVASHVHFLLDLYLTLFDSSGYRPDIGLVAMHNHRVKSIQLHPFSLDLWDDNWHIMPTVLVLIILMEGISSISS